MAIRTATSVALLLLLGFLVTACGTTDTHDTASVPVETTMVVGDRSADIDKVEAFLKEIKAARGVSEGWATDVRPGTTRSAETITMDLMKLEQLQGDLAGYGPSDRTGNLSAEIREVMLDDLKLLLRVAKHDRELYALNTFLRIAPKLDTSLEDDFGVTPQELRAEAVEIAKAEVAEMRPRLREGSSDASGWVVSTMREWQFTPQEIGLTAQDMKSLSQ